MLTRRRFLAGTTAAGAFAVGAAGAVSAARYHGVRRALHAAGVIAGPDRRPPEVDAHVEYGAFDSAFTRGRPGYGLFVPASVPQAVLYCLHGRGGSHRTAFEDLAVHRFVAAAALPWAVAAVDGGDSFWHRRAGGLDAQAMLVEEFMPLIAGKTGGARPVGIGWSMGGFGVLAASLARPGTFAIVVASSPSLWTDYSDAPDGAFDDASDFERNNVIGKAAGLEGRPTRIDCGEDDIFADAVREVRRRAPSLDVHVKAGFHDNATWRSYLPAQLGFISRALAR